MLSFPGNLLPTESCSRSRCRRWRRHRSRRSGVFRLERKANRFIGTMRLSKRCTFYLRASVCACVRGRRVRCCIFLLHWQPAAATVCAASAASAALFIWLIGPRLRGLKLCYICRLSVRQTIFVCCPTPSTSLFSSALSHPALPSSYSYSSIQCEAPSPCLY